MGSKLINGQVNYGLVAKVINACKMKPKLIEGVHAVLNPVGGYMLMIDYNDEHGDFTMPLERKSDITIAALFLKEVMGANSKEEIVVSEDDISNYTHYVAMGVGIGKLELIDGTLVVKTIGNTHEHR